MRWACALLVGAFVAAALAILLGFVRGGLDSGLAILSLLVGGLVAAAAWQQSTPSVQMQRPSAVEWGVIAAFALASFRAFFWLLYENRGDWFVLSPNNLGDMALHIGLIRYLASGVGFWPESQILTGEPLQYPIGADLFNSLLLLVGVPLDQGLVWVGAVACILIGVTLWNWGRGFAIAALIFSGGLAGFGVLARWWAGEWGIEDFVGQYEWKNLFLAMIVTQRGLLFALPAGLILMDEWRHVGLRGGATRIPTWALVVLYAVMPLFSVHAFLFLSILLVGCFVFADSGRARFWLVRIGVAALVPATAFVILVTGFFSASGGVHWLPGWLQGDDPIRFWLWNFGVMLPLWAMLIGWVIWRRDREAMGVVMPATVVFLLCAFVSFAVWPWDNTKLMIWAWLAVIPFVAQCLILPLPAVARWAICFLLFFPGAVSLVGGLDGRHGYRLVSKGDLAVAQMLVKDLPVGARFAAAPEFAHPLILLGRKVAVGYDGHLWSHGLDYTVPMQALETLMMSRPGWENANEQLDSDYLFWGPVERARFGGTMKLWSTKFPRHARRDRVALYDLRAVKPAPALVIPEESENIFAE